MFRPLFFSERLWVPAYNPGNSVKYFFEKHIFHIYFLKKNQNIYKHKSCINFSIATKLLQQWTTDKTPINNIDKL